ncbi:hypothetical protein ACFLZ5_04955 [Thermodesulfobacteriota bacterium]
MQKHKVIYNKKIPDVFFAALASVFVLFTLAGCAGGNYGTVVFDRELDDTFVSYQVLPDHRYFITGGYGAPSAILAIHNDYQLENSANLWVPVPDVNSSHVKKWIDNLSPDENFWEGDQFMAGYILAPNGDKIGAWYSGQRNTTVKFLEGNMVKVYTPNLKPSFGRDKKEKTTIKP